MWQLISSIVVVAGPALIIVYDVIAYRFGGYESTITAAVQWYSSKWPALPGVTAGFMVWLWLHLFLQGMMKGVHDRHPPPEPPAIKNGLNGLNKEVK